MDEVYRFRLRTPKEFWADVRKHGGIVTDKPLKLMFPSDKEVEVICPKCKKK